MKINIWSKMLILVGKVPNLLRRLINRVLQYTTALLSVLDTAQTFLGSDAAKIITSLIPGDNDELLRKALIEVVSDMEALIRRGLRLNRRELKKTMGVVGARVVAKIDLYKHDYEEYVTAFEKVYQENKSAVRTTAA